MRIAHPMTGMAPSALHAWTVRKGGVTGEVGAFGWTRRDAQGRPKFHAGVDWLASSGAPVFAAHDGRLARPDVEQGGGGGYGWRVYLKADEPTQIVTLYAHLAVQFVSPHPTGLIRCGDCIGLVGRSGNVGLDGSVPTHLHFEVRVGESVIDPVQWLTKR